MFGVVGQHMLHPFAGEFTEIDSLIFAFIASGIYFKKKKERKESYIILLVWTDLKCPIELRVQSAPLTCAIDFAVYAIKYLMSISGVEESLGVDQTMLDQDLLWTKNIYIDLHQICSG